MADYFLNDDDLFDYDPSEETAKSTFSGPSSAVKAIEEAVKETKDVEEDNVNIDSAKAKLSSAFHEAMARFIDEVHSEAAIKAISVALNTVTNGDFSYLKMFYETEMRISRKMYFIDIAEKAIANNLSEQRGIIQLILGTGDVEISEFYINTCFKSTVEITRHSVELDRSLYLTLSKKLGIPVNQDLFNENADSSEKMEHNVYLSDYNDQLNEEMNKEINSIGMIDVLKERFGKEVRLNEKEE